MHKFHCILYSFIHYKVPKVPYLEKDVTCLAELKTNHLPEDAAVARHPQHGLAKS